MALRVAVAVAILGATFAAYWIASRRFAQYVDGDWFLLVMAGGAVAAALALRRMRRRPRCSESPWTSDRAWRRGGDVRHAIAKELTPWMLALVVLQIHVAFVVFGAFEPASFMPIAMSCGLLATVVWLARAWFRGGVEVRWDEFPIRTGSRARFHVATVAGGPSMERTECLLRCVKTSLIPGDIAASTRVLRDVPCATPGPLAAGPEEFVTVEFDVPASAPGTDLSRPGEERYWELVVLGTTAWGKIAETFVVPIYAVDAGVSA